MAAESPITVLPSESSTQKLPLASPIDPAIPERRVSVREGLTRYRPNFSEDEPLLRARVINSDRVPVTASPCRK
jgi:hypothetical protein